MPPGEAFLCEVAAPGAERSHATPEEFFLRVNNLAASEGGDYVAKLLDTRGPEVRLGGLAICKETDNRKAKVLLEAGNELKLTTEPAFDGAGDASTMYVNYERIAAKVKVGDQVLLDDGLVTLDVTATDGSTMCRTGPCASTSGRSSARHSRVGATGAYTKRPPASIATTVMRIGTCT